MTCSTVRASPRYQTPPYVILYRPIFTSAAGAAARVRSVAASVPAASAAVWTNPRRLIGFRSLLMMKAPHYKLHVLHRLSLAWSPHPPATRDAAARRRRRCRLRRPGKAPRGSRPADRADCRRAGADRTAYRARLARSARDETRRASGPYVARRCGPEAGTRSWRFAAWAHLERPA